jgi:hypothetical protein
MWDVICFLVKKYFNFKTFPSDKVANYHSFPALKRALFYNSIKFLISIKIILPNSKALLVLEIICLKVSKRLVLKNEYLR